MSVFSGAFFAKMAKRKWLIGTIVVVVAGGGYYWNKTRAGSATVPHYVNVAVTKGTLVVSTSGSGQVSVQNQVDVKPKVSGAVLGVGVTNGQRITAGTVLLQIDASDALKAVRDAQTNLESAKLSLAKLKEPADALALTQAQNALAQANESEQTASDRVKKSYDDGFNTVANAFLDLPTIMAGTQDVLYGAAYGNGQYNMDYYANQVNGVLHYDGTAPRYRDEVNTKFQSARVVYDKNFADYKAASRDSDPAAISALIDETYATTKVVAEAVKSGSNLIQFYEDKLTERNLKPQALADTHLALLNTFTGKASTQLLNLYSIKQGIIDNRNALINAQRSITEKRESFDKLVKGANALDIKSQELSVTQRQNALADANETLSHYTLRAPFDGVVANVNWHKGDQLSSASTATTLVADQRFAQISLNEVDVAKVAVGQKATLTFDALPNLTIAGKVAEIDTLGTVSQGVVTYNVKIAMDSQDERVKPGMSVSAAIITEVKQDALLIQNSAVKTQGGNHYVEVLDTLSGGASATNLASQGVTSSNPPQRVAVEVGASNDTMTEIVSGLNEGDLVVVRTITSTTVTATPIGQGGLGGIRIPGLGGGGGGGRRGD